MMLTLTEPAQRQLQVAKENGEIGRRHSGPRSACHWACSEAA